jgi:hypothetical protein
MEKATASTFRGEIYSPGDAGNTLVQKLSSVILVDTV